MPLGTLQQTTTTGANFIPEIWSPEILRATENALVMAPLVKRFDSMVTGKGDTIHIPNLSNLTATSKSANVSVTLQAPTESVTNISIDQHYESSFLVEDILKVQSNYDLMGEYTSKAGESIARRIDTFVKSDYLGQYQNATVVRTGPNSRFMWGDIYGVPVYYTRQVTSTAGTPTQYHNIMFHKEAIALALQLAPRTQSDYILEYLGNLVVVDTIYGYSAIRPTFGIEVRS